MHIFTGLLCGAASLVLMGVVAWMNYRFTSRLGATEVDGQVFGIGSVAVDVMLAMLSPLVMWGIHESRRVYAWGAAGMVVACGILSFVSAIGFSAEGRDGAAAKRETERLTVRAAQQRLEDLHGKKKRLGTPRSASIIEAELAGLRADRRWVVSKQCTAARQDQIRQWCELAHKLNAEQAAAKETERVEIEIRAATSDLVLARQASGHGLLDAQIDMIVEGTGLAEGKVRVALLFLVAFVMQLGAGFGLALGLAPFQAFLDERKRAGLRKPLPGSHLNWGEPVQPDRGHGLPEVIDITPSAAAEPTASGKAGKKESPRRRRSNRGLH